MKKIIDFNVFINLTEDNCYKYCIDSETKICSPKDCPKWNMLDDLSKIQRYDIYSIDYDDVDAPVEHRSECGDWVKVDDLKHIGLL